jgi:hypothetical protein
MDCGWYWYSPFLARLRSYKEVPYKADLICLHRDKENLSFEKELPTYTASQALLHFYSLVWRMIPRFYSSNSN